MLPSQSHLYVPLPSGGLMDQTPMGVSNSLAAEHNFD